MGLLDREFRATEVALNLKDPALKALFGGYTTVIGQNITAESSLRISPWYAGIQILSGAVASLPCITYERKATGGRRRAVKHPNYKLLHDRPNPWMDPTEYFETGMAHLLTHGNAFSLIEKQKGKVVALWPMSPTRVRLQIYNNKIWYYHYPEGGGQQQLPMESVLHIRGLSSDGVLGYSPVDLARETLGLTKAEEEYRGRFFLNDARPGAVVEYPGNLSDEAYQRFKQDWNDTYMGLGNKYKLGFLESGLKWHDIGFPPEASQFIEGRKFQVEEVARVLRIPLVLFQSTEKATSWGTGIEQFMLGFVQFTLREWLKRWERRINIALFTESEQEKFYAEFLTDDLLRADSKTRAEVLQIWRRNGIINADEWREMENKNPIPKGQGKEYIIESNMQPVSQISADDNTPNGETQPFTVPLNGNGAANGATEE